MVKRRRRSTYRTNGCRRKCREQEVGTNDTTLYLIAHKDYVLVQEYPLQ
jgi:hypothetical protein